MESRLRNNGRNEAALTTSKEPAWHLRFRRHLSAANSYGGSTGSCVPTATQWPEEFSIFAGCARMRVPIRDPPPPPPSPTPPTKPSPWKPMKENQLKHRVCLFKRNLWNYQKYEYFHIFILIFLSFTTFESIAGKLTNKKKIEGEINPRVCF